MQSSPISRAASLSMARLDENIPMKLRDIARTQEQLSSGLRVNRASDDAHSFEQARELELLQRRFEQFEDSISSARVWLDHTQENMDNLADIFAQAYEQGIRAFNTTLDEAEREDMAQFFESMITTTVDALNNRGAESFLHAGSRTSVQPFQVDPLDPTADRAGVVYYGNDARLTRQIGPGSSMAVNISGLEVWNVDENRDGVSEFTATESLQDMIDALRAGDQDALKTAIDRVESARDHFINQGAEIGAVIGRLNLSETQLADATLSLSKHQSQLEDADYAETILEFQKAQSSLSTSLQITGTLLQTSLLNFI